MSNCSMCEFEALFKCRCNKRCYCQKCYDKHCKKKGKHDQIKLEESALVKKSVSFAGSDGNANTNKEKKKEALKVEIQEDKKNLLKKAIEKEIAKLQRFKMETLACVNSQQQMLVRTIIDDSKKLSKNVINECKPKQQQLESTITDLEVVGKIPFGHPIIERLKKNTPQQSILKLDGNLKKINLTSEKILEFKIEWQSNPIIDELKEYYKANQTLIPPKLQKIYQKIFSEKHYSIKKINLSKSKIDLPALNHFMRIVSFFSGIKDLRMASNKISNECCDVLAEALSNFKLLEKLDLSDNDLRGHGIEVLTPVLEEMKNLSVLSLAKNNFGATGARHLSMMLESLKKLKELDLDANGFGAEGARYLSGALPKLIQLKNLRLRNNNFADDSVRFLKVALGKMQNIEILKLDLNKFGNEEKRTMQLIVRKECKIEI
ncbi:hypothetical protein SteCoe_14315 [Stentor coeruleus]|uniref:B box-type domain-containing protein n=1 Tax=Stentor coeruleus TaxID=5963 RepID=A0A1R2C656_9CILI|nr:hypothetical protein SteCoe_14315 [Stentor coeruleus]